MTTVTFPASLDQGLQDAASETLPLGPLGELSGVLFRIAQVKAFENFYTLLGERGLKPGEHTILAFIGCYPGVRQGVVANTLRIKRSNMAKIVQVLVDRKMIKRNIPPDDRRSVCLTLTAAGLSYVEKSMPLVVEADQKSVSMLTERERETLTRLLLKVIESA